MSKLGRRAVSVPPVMPRTVAAIGKEVVGGNRIVRGRVHGYNVQDPSCWRAPRYPYPTTAYGGQPAEGSTLITPQNPSLNLTELMEFSMPVFSQPDESRLEGFR